MSDDYDPIAEMERLDRFFDGEEDGERPIDVLRSNGLSIPDDADLDDEKFGRTEGITINQILKGWAKQGIPDEELLRRGMDLIEGLYHSIE